MHATSGAPRFAPGGHDVGNATEQLVDVIVAHVGMPRLGMLGRFAPRLPYRRALGKTLYCNLSIHIGLV